MVVDFSAKQLFGCDPAKANEKIGEKFIYLSKGFLSFPLNIPGTAFHKCLKVAKPPTSITLNNISLLNLVVLLPLIPLEYDPIRKVVTDSITATLKERLASSENYQGDLLDHLLRDQHAEKFLSEDFIVNIVFGLLLASSESMSVTVTLALKFLAENPQALEELLVEHEGVMKNRENPGSPLTWDEVKSMHFSLHVINESLRLGNASLGLLRRTLKDIQINVYPDMYSNPLSFNPWRWKDLEPDVISKKFMPFGGGARQCAGAEFAKWGSPYLKLPSNQVSNLQARVRAPSFLSSES
ncbi:hypothetical protein Ancab_028178 [Ancistrocladus abbreviatus]